MLGIPTIDEAVRRYCAATDRRSVPDLNWYFAYNLFRLMAIVQGICKRVLEGTASNSAGRGDGRSRPPPRGAGLGERAKGRRPLMLLHSREG